MAVHRINLANNKKTTQVKHAKREIADLLGIHKDEKARIKVEHIIREDFTIEGYEILELLCELMHERIRQITNAKECPDELREAASSLIWAAHNVDIDELREVANQLTKKFGSKFSKAALNNENNVVNDRLFQKLSYRPPSAYLVIKYLEEIARTYDIDWEPSESELSNLATMANDQPFSSPSGSSIAMAPGSGLTSAYRAAGPAPEPPQLPPLNDYERAEYEQFLRNQGKLFFAY